VVKEGGLACMIGPVHPTFFISRFFADMWMLFPTEQEYIDVGHCPDCLHALLRCIGSPEPCCQSFVAATDFEPPWLCTAVVHKGGLHGCQDQAHRAQVLPRRARPRPHHGLLRHRHQAQGVCARPPCGRLAAAASLMV
jgi:hypothetical protein